MIKMEKETQLKLWDDNPLKLSIQEIYGASLLSVIDGSSSQIINRSAQWKRLGIESEITREGVRLMLDKYDNPNYPKYFSSLKSVSIFNPALTELIYNWFIPTNGSIIDPFAGGSVRGIVAGMLGYQYTGIDIREAQVLDNYRQARSIIKHNQSVEWITGDALIELQNQEGTGLYDGCLTCPPYYGLEKYSDDPLDISNWDKPKFDAYLNLIATELYRLLKNNSFAVIVVGDVRCKRTGNYMLLPDAIRSSMTNAGFGMYNYIIWKEPIVSRAIYSRRYYESSKKIAKIHQEVLVFRKT